MSGEVASRVIDLDKLLFEEQEDLDRADENATKAAN